MPARAQTMATSTTTATASATTLKLQSAGKLGKVAKSAVKSAPGAAVDLPDESIMERMEEFVLQVEHKLENLEKIGAEFIDEKFHAMARELAQLKLDVLDRGVRATESMVQTFETHMEEINDKALSLSERWRRGVEFYENSLTTMEASHIEASLERARDRLLTRSELPLEWHNNPYIHSGYQFCRNYAECVRGAFHIHNETCNIWTHAIALVVVLCLSFLHLPSLQEWHQSNWSDVVPVMIFLVAAAKCLVCSVTWHTFCNISNLKVHKNMACVDYTGIMLLITASLLTVEYATLYCHPKTRNFHLAITSLSGLAGVFFTWHPAFDKLILLRVTFFIGFASAGAIAGVHAMYYEGFWPVFYLHLPVFKSLASYLAGVVFYAGRIPERFFKDGRFDYIGMSHNLWHLAVFGGIYYHYQACITLLRHGVSATCAI